MDRKGEILYDIPYMWNLTRNDKNEHIQNRLTDLKEQTYGCQGRGWGYGIVREFGINIYTLLYLKWITNKVLLHSTGNSAQY